MAKQVQLPSEYPIPNSWLWIEMGKLVIMRNGFPFDSKRFSEECEGRRPLIRIRDVVRGATETFTDEDCPDEYIIHYGDILIGMDGDFNVAKWKSNDGLLNQRVCYICSASNALLNDYLYYYLPDPLKKINEVTPSVTVKHLSTKTLEKTPIPLPSLAEQQRIVDRIESLFAKLDEAKEKAQAVVDGFEDRKAAILHKAFTGELTEKWRAICGLSLDGWENAPLEKVFQLRSGFTIEISDEKEFGSIPYVKVADMNLPDNKIQITTSSRFVDDCPDSRIIPNGSTIFPKRGGAILTNKKRYVGVEKIIADLNIMAIMPITEKAFGWYGYYWMQSVDLRKLNNGSNVPQINNKDMVKLSVPTPPIEEQIEIVRVLDRLLSKEQQAKEAAEQVIDQIDSMKKSILARAFRGELGTNDPDDESAVELLKRVL